jgi:hypothetical protein
MINRCTYFGILITKAINPLVFITHKIDYIILNVKHKTVYVSYKIFVTHREASITVRQQ